MKLDREIDGRMLCVKYDEPRSDQIIVRRNAFIKDNGKIVPLIINDKERPCPHYAKVVGRAVLENCDDGVYANYTLEPEFKDLPINKLDVFANKVKFEDGFKNIVTHGVIWCAEVIEDE